MSKKPSNSQQRQNHVTPSQFIEAWETSDSAKEAAEKLGMTRSAVSARASQYRKKGILLKKMARTRRGPTLTKEVVADLNRLVEEIRARSQASANPKKWK